MSMLRHVAIATVIGLMPAAVCAETIEEIRQHIQTRCEAYATVDCKWKVVSKFTKLYADWVGPDLFEDGVEVASQKLPATMVWLASFHSAGPKLCLSHNRPGWDFSKARLRRFPQTIASDGIESRSLQTFDSHTKGMLAKAQDFGIFGVDQNFSSVLNQFQASRYPVASLLDPEARVTISEDEWDEHKCLLLRWNHPRQKPGGRQFPKYALWLDPQADYSDRRYTSTLTGVGQSDIHIELGQQAGMWVPKRWRWFDYRSSGGNLIALHSAEMLSMKINQPLDDTVFGLPFPRATVVSDLRETPMRQFLVGEKQRRYEFTREQRRMAESWEDLLQALERN